MTLLERLPGMPWINLPSLQSCNDLYRTTNLALLAQVMMDFLQEWEEKLGIKITCSQVQHRRLALRNTGTFILH